MVCPGSPMGEDGPSRFWQGQGICELSQMPASYTRPGSGSLSTTKLIHQLGCVWGSFSYIYYVALHQTGQVPPFPMMTVSLQYPEPPYKGRFEDVHSSPQDSRLGLVPCRLTIANTDPLLIQPPILSVWTSRNTASTTFARQQQHRHMPEDAQRSTSSM